jgi:hypothetical protein
MYYQLILLQFIFTKNFRFNGILAEQTIKTKRESEAYSKKINVRQSLTKKNEGYQCKG